MSYIITIILALLLTPAAAEARMNVGVLGGGVSAAGSCTGCTPSTDSQFEACGETYNSSFTGSDSWAWSFSVASTKCVTGVTWYVQDGGNERDGVCEIWTDNAGSPNSIFSVGSTSSITNVINSFDGFQPFLFASTQTLPAGDYWAVCRPKCESCAGYNLSSGRAASSTGTIKYSANPPTTTWTTIDYKIMIGVLGCDPS